MLLLDRPSGIRAPAPLVTIMAEDWGGEATAQVRGSDHDSHHALLVARSLIFSICMGVCGTLAGGVQTLQRAVQQGGGAAQVPLVLVIIEKEVGQALLRPMSLWRKMKPGRTDSFARPMAASCCACPDGRGCRPRSTAR